MTIPNYTYFLFYNQKGQKTWTGMSFSVKSDRDCLVWIHFFNSNCQFCYVSEMPQSVCCLFRAKKEMPSIDNILSHLDSMRQSCKNISCKLNIMYVSRSSILKFPGIVLCHHHLKCREIWRALVLMAGNVWPTYMTNLYRINMHYLIYICNLGY